MRAKQRSDEAVRQTVHIEQAVRRPAVRLQVLLAQRILYLNT